MQKEKPGLLTRLYRLLTQGLVMSLGVGLLFSPMLMIAAGAYFGGRYFGGKDSKIKGDGITTTATVYDAGYDHLGSFLQGETDNKLNRSGAQRHGGTKCTIYYRFTAQDGQQIEGSTNREYESLEAAKSEIGSEFEVVYSASNPSVFETALGHTESQADAMNGIAIAFVAIWFLSVAGFTVHQQVKRLKSKSQKKRTEKQKKGS